MIRVTRHPKSPEWLVLKVPREHNQAMGSFGPAQLATDLGGYVMHREKLEALQRFARHIGLQVLNEVREEGEPTPPVECGNVTEEFTSNGRSIPVRCGAPYPANRIPRYCGACGQHARPVIHENDEPPVGERCEGCDRLVRGGAKWCPHCGATMPDHPRIVQPAYVELPRTRLGEPATLGDTMSDVWGTVAEQVKPSGPEEAPDDGMASVEPVVNSGPESTERVEDIACRKCFHPTPSDQVDMMGWCPKCRDVEAEAKTVVHPDVENVRQYRGADSVDIGRVHDAEKRFKPGEVPSW